MYLKMNVGFWKIYATKSIYILIAYIREMYVKMCCINLYNKNMIVDLQRYSVKKKCPDGLKH